MALLPTGSDKILEINTAEVNIVIKSKKNWSGKMLDQSSSIVIDGHDIKRINMKRLVFAKNLMIAQMQQFTI